jgi:hypothetical protein
MPISGQVDKQPGLSESVLGSRSVDIHTDAIVTAVGENLDDNIIMYMYVSKIHVRMVES